MPSTLKSYGTVRTKKTANKLTKKKKRTKG